MAYSKIPIYIYSQLLDYQPHLQKRYRIEGSMHKVHLQPK